MSQRVRVSCLCLLGIFIKFPQLQKSLLFRLLLKSPSSADETPIFPPLPLQLHQTLPTKESQIRWSHHLGRSQPRRQFLILREPLSQPRQPQLFMTESESKHSCTMKG